MELSSYVNNAQNPSEKLEKLQCPLWLDSKKINIYSVFTQYEYEEWFIFSLLPWAVEYETKNRLL
jgi:hypothetical protein